MTQVRHVREVVESDGAPLLALHARIDQLQRLVGRMVAAGDAMLFDPTPEACQEWAGVVREAGGEAAKLDARSPDALDAWLAEQRRKREAEPFISTDKRPRVKKVVTDGIERFMLVAPDGTVVGPPPPEHPDPDVLRH